MITLSALPETIHKDLKIIFEKYPQVKKVILFGSRAKETNTKRSDIDLVIANSQLDRVTLSNIKSEIEESDIPNLVDIQLLEEIYNQELLDHINRVGKVVYRRS
mgnify:FL=1